MKKLILLGLLVSFSLSSLAQRNAKDWYLSVGVNAINTLGSKSPIYHPEDWSYQTPISAAVEFNWTKNFAIEQSITFNGFTDKDQIDVFHAEEELDKDYNYLSFDTHVKYYFGRHIFPNAEWLNFYANAGVGFFHIDETNISANIGGGALVWLNSSRSFGLRGQIISKFALDHSESYIDNNHYQYHLQVIFKL